MLWEFGKELAEVLFVHSEGVEGHDVDLELEITSNGETQTAFSSSWWAVQEVATSVGNSSVGTIDELA